MSQVVFTVRSESTGEHYHLEAYRTATGVRFSCSCPAGKKGTHCKHRLSVLMKDTRACVDVDAETIASFQDLIKGSELLARVNEMNEAEQAVFAAQRNLKLAKEAVGKALYG